MFVGLFGAISLLLGAAGVMKLLAPGATAAALLLTKLPTAELFARPIPIRIFGAAELGVAGVAVFVGGIPAAVALLVMYLMLLLIAWRLYRMAPGADCGCFGSSAEPAGLTHVVVNAAAVVVAGAAIVWPQPSLVAAVAAAGGFGVLLVAGMVLLAWLGYLLMTALPLLLTLNAKVVASR